MSLTAGIVGLPNVGKSTLFNAITKKNILAANYPFATIDPNVGVVTVPDERLEFLENLYIPNSLVPTTFEFTDIAGLVKGASKGEGLGNKFLSHIREVDAIVEVVRCFEDKNIIHVESNIDPIRDIEIINVELLLADLEVIDNRINKIGKKAILSNDKLVKKEAELLNRIKESLEQNIPIRKINFEEEEYKMIKHFNLITAKPIIYMANVSEEDIQKLSRYADRIGLAFQIKDDILSEEGDAKITGKPVGNDKELGKCTYVSQYGLDGAKNKLEKITQEAIDDLEQYGEKAEFLKQLAIYIKERNK